MGTLCYTLLESESDLKSFDCGNASINRLVADSFYPNLLKQIQTYMITLQGHRIGFCSLSIARLSIEDSDAPIAEYYNNSPSYGALQIDFIAIDKKIHNHGVGTNALSFFVDQARKIYNTLPIRVVVLDALRDKLSWYSNRGFVPIKSSDTEGTSETIKMYYDLMPNEDLSILEQYIDQIV